MRATSLTILGLFAFAVQSGAQAAIINGDFETGDLTGWNHVAGGFVVSVEQIDASNKLKIAVDSPAPGGGLAEVYQDFTIAEHGTISLEYSGEFVPGVYSVGNLMEVSFSIAILRDPDTADQQFLGGASRDFFESGATIPLTKIAVEVEPGDYRVFFNDFADYLEGSLAPGTATLIVDNVQFTPVPEPAAMALALAGLGVLTIFARQRR